jgi:hypothetical protein
MLTLIDPPSKPTMQIVCPEANPIPVVNGMTMLSLDGIVTFRSRLTPILAHPLPPAVYTLNLPEIVASPPTTISVIRRFLPAGTV